jgi:hypothetical protein
VSGGRQDGRFLLEQLDLRARVFNPFQFVGSRHAFVAGGENRMQITEPAPLAQMLFRVTGAQDAWILDGEFERHDFEECAIHPVRQQPEHLTGKGSEQ